MASRWRGREYLLSWTRRKETMVVQWLRLAVSNGPNSIDSPLFHLKTEAVPVSETMCSVRNFFSMDKIQNPSNTKDKFTTYFPKIHFNIVFQHLLQISKWPPKFCMHLLFIIIKLWSISSWPTFLIFPLILSFHSLFTFYISVSKYQKHLLFLAANFISPQYIALISISILYLNLRFRYSSGHKILFISNIIVQSIIIPFVWTAIWISYFLVLNHKWLFETSNRHYLILMHNTI